MKNLKVGSDIAKKKDDRWLMQMSFDDSYPGRILECTSVQASDKRDAEEKAKDIFNEMHAATGPLNDFKVERCYCMSLAEEDLAIAVS